MNKSQQLAVMILRAKIKTEETLKQHDVAWNGQEPREVNSGKPIRQTTSEGLNASASNEAIIA